MKVFHKLKGSRIIYHRSETRCAWVHGSTLVKFERRVCCLPLYRCQNKEAWCGRESAITTNIRLARTVCCAVDASWPLAEACGKYYTRGMDETSSRVLSCHKGKAVFRLDRHSCDLDFSGAHCHVATSITALWLLSPLSDCIVCGSNRLNACSWSAQCERLGWRSNMIFRPNSQRAINVLHVAIYCGHIRCANLITMNKTVLFLSHFTCYSIYLCTYFLHNFKVKVTNWT